MASALSNRIKNELSLLAYSLRMLAGSGLLAVVMISGVLLVLILTRPLDVFSTRLAVLIFHLETFAPLLGIVIFSGLLGADLDSRCLENLSTSEEGIARVIMRKTVHSALFATAACLLLLCILQGYTSFNIAWALGIVVPATLYFGMLGLVATAATRKTLAGFTVGTALLLMTVSGQRLDPLRLDSYSSRGDLANMRLLGEGNWLIAKVYFMVMAVVLAFLVARIIRDRKARIRGTLAVVLLLVTVAIGVHWLWARPVPLAPMADEEVIETREADGLRRVRIAVPTVSQEAGRRVEGTLIREERYTRAGGQWVFASSSFFYPNSETDLLHIDLRCEIEPDPAALSVSARLQMRAIDGPLDHVFFFLAGDLELTDLTSGGEAVEFKRRSNLVDVILPEPIETGETIELAMTYHGRLAGIAEGVAADFIALFDDWYPATRGLLQNWVDPFTCRLEVGLPKPWRLAGAEIIQDDTDASVFAWECTIPIHRPALCAGIFREYETRYRDIPVTVHAFTFDEAHAQRLLAVCADVLAVYEDVFGPYPFTRLAFVEDRFQNASGVAHPGMMTLRPDRTADEQEESMSSVLLPHEIAHQWWRLGLPKWLAEGGAVYANYRYLDRRQGRPTATGFLDQDVYTPYVSSVSAIEPLVTDYGNGRSTYARGGYLFVALESLVGKDALATALRAFLERHHRALLVDEEAVNRDCEQALQALAGPGLSSFVTDWIRSSKRFDPSVVQLWQTESEEGYDIAVRLAHKGEIQFPTPVRLELADGSGVDLTWPAGDVQTVIRHQGSQPATRVELDPEHLLLDWNRANNRAMATASSPATEEDASSTIARWKSYTTQDGLSAPMVQCLFFGHDRKLYAGFSQPGYIGGTDWKLNTFDGQWQQLVPDPERGLTILAMAQSPGGAMWIGGYGALYYVDQPEVKQWILKENRSGRVGAGRFAPRTSANSDIPGSDVLALLLDRDEKLWVGTDHGMSVLNTGDGTWRYFSEAEGLGGQAVTALAQGGDGVMWAGTTDGVYSFSRDRWNSHPDVARNDIVLALAVDAGGSVWLGTYRSGILAMGTDGSVRHFSSTNSGVKHDLVSSLVFDPDGRLWFGGGIGLGCFDGKSWTYYDRENSALPSSRIHRLLIDDSNHLWIGTDVGVTRYDL